MTKLCANLSMLYNEVDFLKRFGAAAADGFNGVEYWFPYAFDEQLIVECLGENNLTQVLFNLPAGDWEEGERGIACHPDRVDEFQEGVGQAIDYASALNCKQVNVLAGIAPSGVDIDTAQETLVNNLKFAADKLKEQGVALLIEAINTPDVPDFFVSSTQQTLDLIMESGRNNIFVQYDIYHMQIMEGDLAMTIKNNLSKIAHIQVADNPGRNEPGTGEINYRYLFNYLDEVGYRAWIGCEYNPATTTTAGLAWAQQYMS